MVFVHNLKLTNIGFKTNIYHNKTTLNLTSFSRIEIGGLQKLLHAHPPAVDEGYFLYEMVLFCIKQDKV